MRTALASSATAARDDNATNSPSSSLPPIARLAPRPSSAPISSFADCKSPHQNTPNVAPAPWCAPQVRATIAPVSRVSCTSCSTPRSSSLVRGHSFPWTFSYLWTYSLPIRMFPFSFFILDSSLSLLAPLSLPLPSDFDYRRSFRPRARCRAHILLRSVHCIAADSDRINTPRWPRRKAGKSAHISPSSLCAFPGNRHPFLSRFVSVCVSSSRSLV